MHADTLYVGWCTFLSIKGHSNYFLICYSTFPNSTNMDRSYFNALPHALLSIFSQCRRFWGYLQRLCNGLPLVNIYIYISLSRCILNNLIFDSISVIFHKSSLLLISNLLNNLGIISKFCFWWYNTNLRENLSIIARNYSYIHV